MCSFSFVYKVPVGIEAVNNKIKLVIRKAYGFRNIQNMTDMVCLVC
ncbi:MAG: transposase [Oscillospiraceae bacterium]|nr:transposase [Oscillospiraceae bacterium]